ncbi:hypothetical protein [Fibrivirga algicola]|uniref:Minor tail protein n=1 Tax=Fibrivirga algicola TaxID=2950420 RepID=A0ABX0QAR9_9BACT|nr:hypothetical protein [Fibrivirga algicola]NID09371.1 hypothetical protein [Fibrivirga algicola]
MLRAIILAGFYNNSTSVTVDVAGVAPGTTILICRGEFIIGSAVVVTLNAALVIPVLALGTGDIIQASIGVRGSGSGIPVRVLSSSTLPTGWLTPTTIRVTNAGGTTTDYTAAQYLAAFGQLPADVYDPIEAGLARVPANYEQDPTLDTVDFDLQISQQPGQTTITVLPRSSDVLLVGWNGATPSTAAPLTITTGATVSVTVRRDTDNLTASRTLSVSVLPSGVSGSGAIKALAYRWYANGLLRLFVNSASPVEVAIPGLAGGAYQAGTSYDTNYWEVTWSGTTAAGTYTATARVIGETNPANYYTLVFTI